MKKALSFVLLLSIVAPTFAINTPEEFLDPFSGAKIIYEVAPTAQEVATTAQKGLGSRFFGWGSSILEKGSGFATGVKNCDKTAFAKSCGSSLYGFGSSLLQRASSFSKANLEKASGLATGAIESVKAFDKDVFVASCKQDPMKAFGTAVTVLLVSHMTYQLSKSVYQKALKRIQINKFARALMDKAESNEDFTLEWITEKAPTFLKDENGNLVVSINNFMNDCVGPVKVKRLLTLANEYRAADKENEKNEEVKKAVSEKIKLIKEHILGFSY